MSQPAAELDHLIEQPGPGQMVTAAACKSAEFLEQFVQRVGAVTSVSSHARIDLDHQYLFSRRGMKIKANRPS